MVSIVIRTCTRHDRPGTVSMASESSVEVEKPSEEQIKALVDLSFEAKSKAYNPYSNFRVGAALLTADGKTFTGCNVENVSYSFCVCAERCAIVKAISEGHREFKAIAVACDTPTNYVSPCGGCRQVMAEFGTRYWVILTKPDKSYVVHQVKDLLPLSFSADDLRAGQRKN